MRTTCTGLFLDKILSFMYVISPIVRVILILYCGNRLQAGLDFNEMPTDIYRVLVNGCLLLSVSLSMFMDHNRHWLSE